MGPIGVPQSDLMRSVEQNSVEQDIEMQGKGDGRSGWSGWLHIPWGETAAVEYADNTALQCRTMHQWT